MIERAFVTPELEALAWDGAAACVDEALAIEERANTPGDALRSMVQLYGRQGLLKLVTRDSLGGALGSTSSVALCLARERLGHASPLAELAFAMQGLGSFPITASDPPEGPARDALGEVVAGDAVAAFAITEPNAGTDLGGITTTAQRDGNDYILNGHKCFISNAGVADVYVVFAATNPDAKRRRLSAFVVRSDMDGVDAIPTKVLGGHPIGEVRLTGVRVPATHRLGEEGDGMRLALTTLHRFRPTVGAAALGFAQRALDESVAYTKQRQQFGAPLSQLQLVQARLGEMACEVEAARLLVYRAAAAADGNAERGVVTRTGSMAKLVATESAQRVIDSAVQLHGGRGVSDSIVARLYEDVRALRIYEGTNDVHKLLIARELLA